MRALLLALLVASAHAQKTEAPVPAAPGQCAGLDCFYQREIDASLDDRVRRPARRSKQALAEFRKAHPCPAPAAPRGRCPGYVIDHVKPLCAGGPDDPSNMQWQRIAEAKKKDVDERRLCASLHR